LPADAAQTSKQIAQDEVWAGFQAEDEDSSMRIMLRVGSDGI
jgi:hypothetical protein